MSDAAGNRTIDASVGIKLYLKEPLSEHAFLLLGRRGQDSGDRFYVPDIFYAECCNALWKAVRRIRLPESLALESAARLLSLDLMPVPSPMLIEDAIRIALCHELAVYDACYVAASVRFEAPLITADEVLFRKLEKTPYAVRWLGDMS